MSSTLIVTKSSLDEVEAVPIPDTTNSYKAVPHDLLITKLLDHLSKSLTLESIEFGLAKKGKQLFGVIEAKSKHSDYGYAIGFRNSYDKSLAVGLVGGTRVFVCSNLCFSGDIKYMRRHTSGIDVDSCVQTLVSGVNKKMDNLILSIERLKSEQIGASTLFKGHIFDLAQNNIVPFSKLGDIYEGVINSKHFPLDTRTPVSRYHLYMAVTDHLKKYPIATQSQRLQLLGKLYRL